MELKSITRAFSHPFSLSFSLPLRFLFEITHAATKKTKKMEKSDTKNFFCPSPPCRIFFGGARMNPQKAPPKNKPVSKKETVFRVAYVGTGWSGIFVENKLFSSSIFLDGLVGAPPRT